MAKLNKPNRPEKSLTLEDGTELKMTYLMINDILRYVGGPDEAMEQILMNQSTRDLVIRRLLTQNGKSITVLEDLIPLEEVEIDIFEMDEILSWTLEHVSYFFMKTAGRIQAVVEKYPEMTGEKKTSSSPSETGSTPSPTTTKSAGPTE